MTVTYWLIAAALFAGLEILTQGLTTIWFAGGALMAALLCGMGLSLWLQLLVFASVSVLLLLLTRPLAVRFLNTRVVKTNVDSMAGRTCLVTEAIDNLKNSGQVSVNGQLWSARSKDDNITIEKGQKVKVLSVRGVKLIVEIQEGKEYV